MDKYLIVWTHRHGADVHFIETSREFECLDDDTAWEVLRELGHDVEPERGDEFIETFEVISHQNFEYLSRVKGGS